MSQGQGVTRQSGPFIARYEGPLADVLFYTTTTQRLTAGQLRHPSWIIFDAEADKHFAIKPLNACFLSDGTTPAPKAQWGTLPAHWRGVGSGGGAVAGDVADAFSEYELPFSSSTAVYDLPVGTTRVILSTEFGQTLDPGEDYSINTTVSPPTLQFVPGVNIQDGEEITVRAFRLLSVPAGATEPTANVLLYPGTGSNTDGAIHQQGITALLADKISASQIGAPNGVLGLDAQGKANPASLPSYVSDIVEQPNLAAFPATGLANTIYIALDDNKQYRWGGTVYVPISDGAVESVGGFTGVVTKAQLGISNVDNTRDLDKPVSTSVQTALNAKVTAAAGLGLSRNSYTDEEKAKLAQIAVGGHIIQNNGTTVPLRAKLNFKQAGGATVTAMDNAASNSTDVTVQVDTQLVNRPELEFDFTASSAGQIYTNTFNAGLRYGAVYTSYTLGNISNVKVTRTNDGTIIYNGVPAAGFSMTLDASLEYQVEAISAAAGYARLILRN